MAAPHAVDLDVATVDLVDLAEEVEVGDLAFEVCFLGLHVDRLVSHDLLAARRTHLDADAAAGAVLGRHLDRVQPVLAEFLEVTSLHAARREGLGSVGQRRRFIHLGANCSVWANHGTLATLDAHLRVPDGNLLRDVALLPA